jgi:hypothetical protein
MSYPFLTSYFLIDLIKNKKGSANLHFLSVFFINYFFSPYFPAE